MYAADFREIARKALRGKWKKMALLILLAGILGATVGVGGISLGGFDVDIEVDRMNQIDRIALMVVSAVSLAIGLLCIFVGSWVQVGLHGLGCRVMDGEEPRVAMLFPGGIYWKAVLLGFLRGLFVTLWSLLLIVPGIIARHRYAMADYILYNHPEMGVMDVLRESKRLMAGRKGRLFCLDWSFIGWEVLCLVPLYVLMIPTAIITVLTMPKNPVLFVAAALLGALSVGIGSLFVQAYRHMAFVAFYRYVENGGAWEKEDQEEGEDSGDEQEFDDADETAADPAHRFTALIADETVAKDLFLQHGCSRKRLAREGLLAEYNSMNIDSYAELRWLREYGNELMQRFDREPATLDDLLELCAEYGMDDLLSRALERIDRHIRQETLPAEEILNMAGRTLALATSGVFDDDLGYVQRKREQVSDMADRLERRLKENNPDGSWKNALRLVRTMCGSGEM